jgi:hypothetical protein
MSIEDLRDMVLSLMTRVEELERQLRSVEPQCKAAAIEPPEKPPTYEPPLQPDEAEAAAIGRAFSKSTSPDNIEW